MAGSVCVDRRESLLSDNTAGGEVNAIHARQRLKQISNAENQCKRDRVKTEILRESMRESMRETERDRERLRENEEERGNKRADRKERL